MINLTKILSISIIGLSSLASASLISDHYDFRQIYTRANRFTNPEGGSNVCIGYYGRVREGADIKAYNDCNDKARGNDLCFRSEPIELTWDSSYFGCEYTARYAGYRLKSGSTAFRIEPGNFHVGSMAIVKTPDDLELEQLDGADAQHHPKLGFIPNGTELKILDAKILSSPEYSSEKCVKVQVITVNPAYRYNAEQGAIGCARVNGIFLVK